MVVSPKCAFGFEHKSSIPLSSTYPHWFQTLYLWKGASQMSRAGAAAATAITPFFQKLSKGSGQKGTFFLPFFPLTGDSMHFCVLTHPWFPPPLSLWVFCLLIDGGASLHLLLLTIWYGSSASLRAQAAPDNRATAQLATADKLPDLNPLNHNGSGLVQRYQHRLERVVSLQRSSRAITMSGR